MNINEALNAIQAKLKAPKDLNNTFGKYKYRSAEKILESVKPHLASTGTTLTLNDDIILIGDRYYIRATATLSNGDQEISTAAFAREPEIKKGMDDSQVTGTASSYARKYALNGLFAIDDAKDADTDEYHKRTHGTKAEEDDEAAKLRADILAMANNDMGRINAYISKLFSETALFEELDTDALRMMRRKIAGQIMRRKMENE